MVLSRYETRKEASTPSAIKKINVSLIKLSDFLLKQKRKSVESEF